MPLEVIWGQQKVTPDTFLDLGGRYCFVTAGLLLAYYPLPRCKASR
jgi:hypothetical protein